MAAVCRQLAIVRTRNNQARGAGCPHKDMTNCAQHACVIRQRCRVRGCGDWCRACEPTTTVPKGRLAAASRTSVPRHAPEIATSGTGTPAASMLTSSRNEQSRASGLQSPMASYTSTRILFSVYQVNCLQQRWVLDLDHTCRPHTTANVLNIWLFYAQTWLWQNIAK